MLYEDKILFYEKKLAAEEEKLNNFKNEVELECKEDLNKLNNYYDDKSASLYSNLNEKEKNK